MDEKIKEHVDMELRHAIEIISYVEVQTKGLNYSDKLKESLALRIYQDISRRRDIDRRTKNNNRR